MLVEPRCRDEPQYEPDRSDREVPADEDQLRRPANRGQERDFVENMGDCLKRRRDPGVAYLQPGAEAHATVASSANSSQ